MLMIAALNCGCEQNQGKKDDAERWFDNRPPTWDRWPGTGSNNASSSSTSQTNQQASNPRSTTTGSAAGTSPTTNGTGQHRTDAPGQNTSQAATKPVQPTEGSPPRSRALLVGPGDPRLGPVPIDRVINASGLVIEDLVRGEGATCLPGMNIRVRYTAAVLDGKVFDRADGDPVTLDLDQCIRAWKEGLPGMRVGGVRQLVSPPELAFGQDTLVDDDGRVIVPSGSAVVFVVELLGITPANSNN